MEKRIVNYFLNLKRNNDIEDELHKLIQTCSIQHEIYDDVISEISYFIDLYTLIAYTRDYKFGLGERDLTYKQIWVWYHYYPKLAIFALECCVKHFVRPYGSFRDIRNFALFVKNRSSNHSHPLIDVCVTLFAEQLEKNNKYAAKWCPRENGKYKWLFRKIALKLAQRRFYYCDKNTLMYKALRLILSKCSFTIESNLCNKHIDYDRLSGKHIQKYKSVLYKQCDFILHIMKSSIITSHGLSYYYFVNHAIRYKHYSIHSIERICLQKQWLHFLKTHKKFFTYTIPILDLSRKMENDYNHTLYNAIGFAIHLSILSIHKRLLVYSSSPNWINFTFCRDFTDMVSCIFAYSTWGNESCIENCFYAITTCFQNDKNIKDDLISKLTFIIISNSITDQSFQTIYSLFKKQPKWIICGALESINLATQYNGFNVNSIYDNIFKTKKKNKHEQQQHEHKYLIHPIRNILRKRYTPLELKVYDEMF